MAPAAPTSAAVRHAAFDPYSSFLSSLYGSIAARGSIATDGCRSADGEPKRIREAVRAEVEREVLWRSTSTLDDTLHRDAAHPSCDRLDPVRLLDCALSRMPLQNSGVEQRSRSQLLFDYAFLEVVGERLSSKERTRGLREVLLRHATACWREIMSSRDANASRDRELLFELEAQAEVDMSSEVVISSTSEGGGFRLTREELHSCLTRHEVEKVDPADLMKTETAVAGRLLRGCSGGESSEELHYFAALAAVLGGGSLLFGESSTRNTQARELVAFGVELQGPMAAEEAHRTPNVANVARYLCSCAELLQRLQSHDVETRIGSFCERMILRAEADDSSYNGGGSSLLGRAKIDWAGWGTRRLFFGLGLPAEVSWHLLLWQLLLHNQSFLLQSSLLDAYVAGLFLFALLRAPELLGAMETSERFSEKRKSENRKRSRDPERSRDPATAWTLMKQLWRRDLTPAALVECLQTLHAPEYLRRKMLRPSTAGPMSTASDVDLAAFLFPYQLPRQRSSELLGREPVISHLRRSASNELRPILPFDSLPNDAVRKTLQHVLRQTAEEAERGGRGRAGKNHFYYFSPEVSCPRFPGEDSVQEVAFWLQKHRRSGSQQFVAAGCKYRGPGLRGSTLVDDTRIPPRRFEGQVGNLHYSFAVSGRCFLGLDATENRFSSTGSRRGGSPRQDAVVENRLNLLTALMAQHDHEHVDQEVQEEEGEVENVNVYLGVIRGLCRNVLREQLGNTELNLHVLADCVLQL